MVGQERDIAVIHNNIKEQIKLYISINDFLCDKRLPTDEDLDKYIINTYTDNINIEFYKDDFITWGVFFNAIVIKDFIASHNNGLQLFLKVFNKAKELNLPIIGYVHFSNKRLLHVAIKRFGFKIVNKVGLQYQIVKEINQGR